MKYPLEVKSARLQAVAERINAGEAGAAIEIIGSPGQGVLARIPLPAPAAEVRGDTLTILGLPAEVRALADGTPAMGRIVNGAGEIVVDELKRGPGGDFEIDQETLRVGQTTRCNQLLIIHP